MQPSYLCCHWTAGKICPRPPSDIQRKLSDFCHNRVLVQWTMFTQSNPIGVRKCKIFSQIFMRTWKFTWSKLYTGLDSQSWVPSGTVFAKNSSMGSFCNCCNINNGKNRVSHFRRANIWFWNREPSFIINAIDEVPEDTPLRLCRSFSSFPSSPCCFL